MLFYKLDDLSSKVIDIINVFVLPFINIYCLICSLLLVIVFSSNQFKTAEIYQYLLAKSVACTFYFCMSSFISLIRCSVYCPYGYEYGTKFYELYIYYFLGKIIEVFTFLIDINLCVIKYRSFSTKNRNKKLSSKLIFAITIIGFIAIGLILNILPTFFGRTIVQIGYLASNRTVNNLTVTLIERPLFQVTKTSVSFYMVTQIIASAQGLIFVFLIFIMDMLITYKLRSFLAKKQSTVSCKIIILLFLIGIFI